MAHKAKVAGIWRKRFLGALARTGNARLAAKSAGVDHGTAYSLRKRDSRFAAAWVRARNWGLAREKSAGRPAHEGGRPRAAGPAEGLDPRPLKARPCPGGGTVLVRCGEGRMSPETDRTFLAHLAAGHGVRRSAALAGFSPTAFYERRMLDPGFQAQWEAAKAQCLARNDMLLIDCVPRALDPEAAEAAEDLPRPTIAEAIRITRLYQAQAAGRPGRGREAPEEEEAPKRSAEEIFDALSLRVREIREEEAQGKLASGWIQDETGHWIPPGWTRTQARR